MNIDVLYAKLKIQGARGIQLSHDGILLCCSASGAVLSLPIGLTGLADGCLSGISTLEKIFIPSTVTVIGIGVLANCPALRYIVIPQCLWQYKDSLRRGTDASVFISDG